MQLRTFIANDMREALSQVRKEMGPDAVIVASQRAKGGGIMVRAAFDGATDVSEEEIAIASADAAPTELAPTESQADFAQSYHEGLIRRLRSEPEPSQPAKSFNRAELLGILRSHQLSEFGERRVPTSNLGNTGMQEPILDGDELVVPRKERLP